MKKFAITGTSPELVAQARLALDQYAGTYDPSIVNLGCDFAPGKHLSVRKAKQKRNERWAKGRRRLGKIRSLRNPK
eukprot:8361893-Pyramimonas_sp.AAC.1